MEMRLITDGGLQYIPQIMPEQLCGDTGAADSGETVASGEILVVSGSAVNTVVAGGTLLVFSGGTAVSARICSGGSLTVSSGGSARNTVISGGRMSVSAGVASAAEVTNGSMGIRSGGRAENIVVNSDGLFNIYNRATAVSARVNNKGNVYVYSGGLLSSAVVSSGGQLHLNKGTVTGAVVSSGGTVVVNNSGIAGNVTVRSGGSMQIVSGGICTGTMLFEAGAVVSAAGKSRINFDISTRSINDGYILNDFSCINGTPSFSVTVGTEQAEGAYKLAQNAAAFADILYVDNGSGSMGTVLVTGGEFFFYDSYYALSKTNGNLILNIRKPGVTLTGSAGKVSWRGITDANITVEYSTDNFDTVLSVVPRGNALDCFGLPAGRYQWRIVKTSGAVVHGSDIVVSGDTPAQKFAPSANNTSDIFFAGTDGVWDNSFAAEHQGVYNGSTGTGEQAGLNGKNRITGIFAGSTDANTLVLTDDANGDALFLEDLFTALPSGLSPQARLSAIDEIRAGSGSDVIDLTGQRFALAGESMLIYGGDGSDVIWANDCCNTIFGDRGDDRIIGGKKSDIITGGAGNDTMHGGGGADIFCFGGNWGCDLVEQSAGNSVTLCFEDGHAANWNAATMTYTDGSNSVKVSGVSASDVTLNFGDDSRLPAGAFAESASGKIFEVKDHASGSGKLA